MNLEELGFSHDEIEKKVVDQICDQVLSAIGYDEDGEYEDNTRYMKSLNKAIKEKLDAAIVRIADEVVLPNIDSKIENHVMKSTNAFGEEVGESKTYTEYLAHMADKYMLEDVDYNGKPKSSGYGSFTKKGTRIAYMIDKHLHYHIEKTMKEMLQDANSQIAEGITKTVRTQLSNILPKIKATVKV